MSSNTPRSRIGKPSARFIALRLGAGLVALLAIDLPAQVATRVDRDAVEHYRGREVVAHEVLVALRPSSDLARLRADVDADDDGPVGTGRLRRIHSRSRDVASLISALSSHRDVAYVEPNYIVYAVREPNDPRFPELWGLRNIGQVINGTAGVPGADISAPTAWDKALGSRNTVVGVVDTGVDYSHPDLAANVWSAPSSFTVTVGGKTITCAAGTHGFNAITKACDPFDDHFHGTHVSGTIGGVGNNGVGVAGVNWFASIMGLKFLSANGSGTTSDAINAIEFAIQAKARFNQAANVRVLSNSWGGGPFSQALLDEIVRAGQNDMLFVAAAGNSASDNDATPFYPASFAAPNVVAVAATDNQDALASFSNFGATSVHLGAPGVQVLSSVPGAAYAYFSGTSMATPHVSGSAALLLSRCPADTATLKALILNNVDPIASLNGKTLSNGRLNVGRAVAACGRASNVAPSVTLTAPSGETRASTPGSVFLAASASDSDGSVAQVAFYAGTIFLGAVTSAPYQLTWNNPIVGNHLLTAVATDNEGATTTSAPAVIRVLPTSPPFGGAEIPIPGIVEAENFNEGGEGLGYHDLTVGNIGGLYRQTDVDIFASSDAGGGYALGYVDAGEWLAYSISAFATGNYTLEARVASLGAGGAFHVELDGIDVTGRMNVPDTTGWQTWQSITSPVIPIAAGSHLLRVVMDVKGASGWVGNFNYFRFTAPGVNRPPLVSLTSPVNGSSYLTPVNIALTAAASDPDGTVAQVAFYAGTSLLFARSVAPFTFSWNNVSPGTYNLTAVATDNLGATTTSAAVTVQVANPPDSTPFGGTPAVIPGTIEAENFDDGGEGIAYHDSTAGNAGGQYRQTDVDIASAVDSGGGYTIGWVTAGEWLKYTVSVVSTGTYTLEVRVASAGTGGIFHVDVDGVDATGPLVVPNTGGWQTWRSIPISGISLSAGRHTLRLVVDSSGATGYLGNVNFLRWTPNAAGNAPPVVQITTPADGSTVPPASVTISASATDSDGTITQVAFYVGTVLMGVSTAPPYSVTWTGAAVGDYRVTARALDNAGGIGTAAALVHVAGPPAPSPFGGLRAAIPGTIEAENFDDGGEGLAYHDSTAGNAGGQYRQTDVDITGALDTGGGYTIGWVTAGEWLAYSVAVNATGNYTLQVRVASIMANGTFHVEIDGVNVTGPLTVPNTGGWQTWATLTRSGIPLVAGPHLMKIVFDTAAANGFVGNFNYVQWVSP